jgi:hypothetical protein
MMKPEFTVNGRKFPRGEIDMELEYALIIKRGARKVFIGRGVNKHEAAPFIEFLKRKGIEVVIG